MLGSTEPIHVPSDSASLGERGAGVQSRRCGDAARLSGMRLTKEAFLNHLYGGMDEPEMKIIDVIIDFFYGCSSAQPGAAARW